MDVNKWINEVFLSHLQMQKQAAEEGRFGKKILIFGKKSHPRGGPKNFKFGQIEEIYFSSLQERREADKFGETE